MKVILLLVLSSFLFGQVGKVEDGTPQPTGIIVRGGTTASVKSGSVLPSNCTSRTATRNPDVFIRVDVNLASYWVCGPTDNNWMLSGSGLAGDGIVISGALFGIDTATVARFSWGTQVPSSCNTYGSPFFFDTDNAILYHCNGLTYTTNSAAVSSWNNRVGDILPQSGDYSASQVTNAADVTTANSFVGGQVFNPSATLSGMRVACNTVHSSPLNGDIICDSTDSSKVKIRSGGAWITIEAQAGSSAISYITASNNGYFPPFGSVGTGSTIAATSGGAVNAANTFRVMIYQFTLPTQMDLQYLVANVVGTGVAGCKFNMAIFNPDKTLRNEMVAPADCSVAGTKKNVVTNPGAIAAGAYFLAMSSTDTNTTISSWNTSSTFTGMLNTGTDNRFGFCSNQINNSTGAMPSSCGTLSETSLTGFPMVALQP